MTVKPATKWNLTWVLINTAIYLLAVSALVGFAWLVYLALTGN